MNSTDSLTFTVTLASNAHDLAVRFRRQHRDSQKANQVYLNTLAVYAVNYYLQCLGIETDWESSQSWNPVIQALMNVADLKVSHRGTLECCPILAGERIGCIAPEAQTERIGFVLVQLNAALTEATLLGFCPHLNNGSPAVDQMRSLDDLPEYLHPRSDKVAAHLAVTSSQKPLVNLANWLQETFDCGWQTVESLLQLDPSALPLACGFRSFRGKSLADLDSGFETSLRSAAQSQLPEFEQFNESNEPINGVKVIHLLPIVNHLSQAEQRESTIALLVSLVATADDRRTILLQVHPTNHQPYLPQGLKLQILSENNNLLQEIRSDATNDYIQKRLIATIGERFNVRIELAGAAWMEQFVV
jgi:hypothetical protein